MGCSYEIYNRFTNQGLVNNVNMTSSAKRELFLDFWFLEKKEINSKIKIQQIGKRIKSIILDSAKNIVILFLFICKIILIP